MKHHACTVKVFLTDETEEELDCVDEPQINDTWLSCQTPNRWVHFSVAQILKYETRLYINI